ncbi:G2/mitotic-specific cyclin-B3 [Hetaerina americana]|uniref:G2/mitotic-specific cyclin-B3 n=1 Tax=Hetaerina americana TaxID=62018 RepID=UPI003A7F3671
MDLKSSKKPFPFLRKGTGLLRVKYVNSGTNSKKTGEGTKRKANFSPKKDEQTKKPLVDNTNGENRSIRVVSNDSMKYTNLRQELENIMPGSMILRPRVKQNMVTQPKPPPLANKGIANPRPKLAQNYAVKSAPPEPRKKSEITVNKSDCNSGPVTTAGPKETVVAENLERSSLDSLKSDDNLLYVTALEESLSAASLSDTNSGESGAKKSYAASAISEDRNGVNQAGPSTTSTSLAVHSSLPPDVEDFDRETWNDPYLASCYAMDIFSYLKSKEACFVVDGSYLKKHRGITAEMRAFLVDWMVEVQETFELNHETLYLAVKIVDLFLSSYNRELSKEKLQLLGATAAFIASKYDEKHLPTVEDFKLVCDGAYSRTEFMSMEILILKTLDFNLGIPLSYRFLRRYARCIKSSMQLLTLARYILESSLMEYRFISRSDSKMGAASLLLALKMLRLGGWNPTLEYYSGYTLSEIKDLTYELNAMIHKEPRENCQTIKNKYSHRIFLEVALIPLLDDKDLGLDE